MKDWEKVRKLFRHLEWPGLGPGFLFIGEIYGTLVDHNPIEGESAQNNKQIFLVYISGPKIINKQTNCLKTICPQPNRSSPQRGRHSGVQPPPGLPGQAAPGYWTHLQVNSK